MVSFQSNKGMACLVQPALACPDPGQAAAAQSAPSRIIALRMTISLRMQATRMTFGFLPFSRAAKALSTGLTLLPTSAAQCCLEDLAFRLDDLAHGRIAQVFAYVGAVHQPGGETAAHGQVLDQDLERAVAPRMDTLP